MPASPPAAAVPKTGKAGIWVGIVLIVVGVLAGIGAVVAGARSVVVGVDGLQRVPAATGGTVEVDDIGSVKVYAERDVAGSAPTSYSSSTSGGPVPDVELVVTGPDGERVPIERVRGSEEYQSDGHWGTRVGRFDAPEPGTYRIEVAGGDDPSRRGTIAVGNSVQARGLWLILAGVLGGGFVVFVGVVVLVVSAIRRGRARKRALTPPSYPAGPHPPGSGPPQPGWTAPPVGPPPSGWPPAPPAP